MSDAPYATIDLSGPSVDMGLDAQRLFSDCWMQAIRAESMLAPTAPMGSELLRDEIGRCVGHDPAEVVVTAGVRSAIPLLSPFLRSVAVEVPTFEDVPSLLGYIGCDVRRLAWDQILNLTDPVWITSPARNPDGATLTPEEQGALEASNSSIVVVNETYRWGIAHRVSYGPGFVAVGSFSKLAGTGLRVGWLRGQLAARLPSPALRCASPPAPIQHAWGEFLRRGGLDLAARTFVDADAARAAFVTSAGTYLRQSRLSSGPALLALLPVGLDERTVQRILGDQGLLANEGRHFGAPMPSLRFCFAGVPPDAAHAAGERYAAALTGLVGDIDPTNRRYVQGS